MKKVFSHMLPVTRVLYANGNGNKETTIVHLCSDIYEEEKGSGSYWHTHCGANIDWHGSATVEEINYAIEGKYDYKLCSRCKASPEEFMNAKLAEIEFDHQRRIEEDKEEEEEEEKSRQSKIAWDEKMKALDIEVADILESRMWCTDEERESIKYYTVRHGGKSYRIEVTIKDYDPSKEK